MSLLIVANLLVRLCDAKHYFIAATLRIVDAIIELLEGFATPFQATGNEVGAENDSSVTSVVDAIANSQDGRLRWLGGVDGLQSRNLSTVRAIVAEDNAIVANWRSIL